MNISTIVIGIAGLLFGIYTAYIRNAKPEKFGKLKAMQERYGAKHGTIVHIVFYSIVPIIFGGILIFAGFMGISLI